MASVGDCDFATLADADYLLLGCWTSGLFVILQHPDEPWLAFVRDMPETKRPRVALFTTYLLATGSQFPKMRAALAGKTSAPATRAEVAPRPSLGRGRAGAREVHRVGAVASDTVTPPPEG